VWQTRRFQLTTSELRWGPSGAEEKAFTIERALPIEQILAATASAGNADGYLFEITTKVKARRTRPGSGAGLCGGASVRTWLSVSHVLRVGWQDIQATGDFGGGAGHVGAPNI
jgi:hypothetical protein